MRRTKILATIGPASREPAALDALLAAGVDAVRLNFSHGDHAWHEETYRRVRAAAARAGREIAVLADLQGPKIRLGRLAGPVEAKAGSRLVISAREGAAGPGVVPTDYKGLPGDCSPGMVVLLDDGKVRVRVESAEGQDVVCRVEAGGTLSSHKGLNVPGAALTAAAMTDKDRADARFALDLGADYLALSFVRRAGDVDDLKRLMEAHGRGVPVIAKIEKPQAIDALDEILAAADGVMVARGDLAVEASLELIPAHQKRIIERANAAGKLVVTATQMLESMTENPLPTRAEVTDVANAVLDGTDAVMLSGETAVGRYPAEAVARMASIAAAAEETLYPFEKAVRPRKPGESLGRVAARLAAEAARQAQAAALAVFTRSGDSAVCLSDERPRCPILAFSPDRAVLRRLALYWGVRGVEAAAAGSVSALMEGAASLARRLGLAKPGDALVYLLGAHVAPDADHSVKLLRLDSPRETEPK